MSFSRFYKIDAIILKRKNTGEADKILTVFSKEFGKLKLMAKGVRKVKSRRAPHLEVFNRTSLLLFRGKTWDTITEVVSHPGQMPISGNFFRMGNAYFYSELVDGLLPEKQEHTDIFDLLREYLEGSPDKETAEKMRNEFAVRLLRTLGYIDRNRTLPSEQIELYIETLIERNLKSPRILRQMDDRRA